MRGDMPKKVVMRARSGEVSAWSVSLRGDIHITVTRGGLGDTPEGCPEIEGYGSEIREGFSCDVTEEKLMEMYASIPAETRTHVLSRYDPRCESCHLPCRKSRSKHENGSVHRGRMLCGHATVGRLASSSNI